MPVYDYVCSACRHRTEVIHGINEDGPRFCPACGKEGTMRKGFSTPSIVFKGSGWAKKDRATSAHRSASSRSSANNSGSGSSPDSASSASGDSTSAKSESASGGSAGSGGGSDRGASESSKSASTSSKPTGGD